MKPYRKGKNGSTGPKRTPFERERDLERVTALYLRGKTLREIAAELGGLSHSTVRDDVERVKARWRESALVNVDEAMNRELARLDLVEAEYWKGWDRSFENDKPGDPSFLGGVLRCLAERARIFGLYAPEKSSVELRRPGLTPEQRTERIRVLLEKASA